MTVQPVVTLTRKEIYDEVWSMAVTKIALKYNIPYAAMLKQIKDAEIPIPPVGYWTKKEHNKETVTIPLHGDPNVVVNLYTSRNLAVEMKSLPIEMAEQQEKKESNATRIIANTIPEVSQNKIEMLKEEQASANEFVSPVSEVIPTQPNLGEPEVEEGWDGKLYKVFHREVLYQEVWHFPISEVAQKYDISDKAIQKICRALEIPMPPASYWQKILAGKHVKPLPLLKNNYPDATISVYRGNLHAQATSELLAHLSEEEQIVIKAVASQILLTGEKDKLHFKVAAYQKKVSGGQHSVITEAVAKETIPRTIRILDSIVKAAEALGIVIDDSLRFGIGQDFIFLRFSEATTEKTHEMTREEKMAMLQYQDELKYKRWASKPNIRKYDRVFTGRISVGVGDKRRIRDSKTQLLEERIGEILISIFAAINEQKLAREEREEAERKRQEEERRREEQRKRYNQEVADTEALVNQAEDYEVACKIRAMVEAVEAQGDQDEKTQRWVAWAKAKADWYDPTIAAVDEFFGKRNHSKNKESKALHERWSRYW